jgi:hypothetical protein
VLLDILEFFDQYLKDGVAKQGKPAVLGGGSRP